MNFFIVGEVAGADSDADRFLEVLGTNLSATLDIGEIGPALTAVAKGLAPPKTYFDLTAKREDDLGSHRDAGLHRVSILDDHDHVCRISASRTSTSARRSSGRTRDGPSPFSSVHP